MLVDLVFLIVAAPVRPNIAGAKTGKSTAKGSTSRKTPTPAQTSSPTPSPTAGKTTVTKRRLSTLGEKESRKKGKTTQETSRSPAAKAQGGVFRPEFKKACGSLVLASEKGADAEVAKALLKGIVIPSDREACEEASSTDLENIMNKAIYAVSVLLL